MCGGYVGKITGLDKFRDEVLEPLGLGMSWIGDFTEDVNDFLFHGGLEDAIRDAGRWIDDEIIQPVHEFQKGVVNGILEDPLKFIFDTVMIVATGGTYLAWKWMVDASYVLARGGDFSDALKAGVTSYITANYAPQIGGVVGDAAGTYAANFTSNAGVQAAIENMITQGTVQGTVAFVSGDNFGEGFVEGVFLAGSQMATSKVMGYIEEKGGFSFEQNVFEEDGTVKTVPKVVQQGGKDTVIFEAVTELKMLPQIAQDLISVSLAAELQGEEITPELLANAATKSLITGKFLNKTLDKIPGIDWDSDLGQEYAGILLPAVQQSVANVLVNGLNEESGLATANYMLAAMDEHSQQQLFDELASFMGSIDVVDSAGNAMKFAVDTVTGTYAKVNEKLELIRAVDNETVLLFNERNALAGEYLEKQAKYEEANTKFETDNPYYIAARTEWLGALTDPVRDADGNITGYEGISPGYEEFESPAELYAYTLEQQNIDAPSYEEVRRQEEYLQRLLGDMSTYSRLAFPELDVIDARLGELEGERDVLIVELQPLENNLISDIDDMNEALTPLVEVTNKTTVEAIAPSFDAEEYKRINGISDEEIDAYTHYLQVGARTGAFTSDIQQQAANDRALALFRDQVIQSVGGKNATVQYLISEDGQDTTKLDRFNEIVDTVIEENFIDDLGKVDPSKLFTYTYIDADGNPTTKEEAAGYTVTIPDVYADAVSSAAVQFDNYLSQDFNIPDAEALINSGTLRPADIELAEGVDWVDVLNGGGVGYNPVTGRNEYVSKLTDAEGKDVTMWDAMSGAVDTVVDGGVSLEDVRRSNPETFWEFMGSIGTNLKNEFLADLDESEVALADRNAYVEGKIDAAIEGSKRFVGTSAYTFGKIIESHKERSAENIAAFRNYTASDLIKDINSFYEANIATRDQVPLDFEDTRGAQVYKNISDGATNALAITDGAIANITQSFNGMLYVVAGGLDASGIDHDIDSAYIENTRLNRWAKDVITLSEGAKTEEWKAKAKELNELMAVRAEDDPSTPYVNEAVWSTMQILGGAYEAQPAAFLGEVLYSELVEESVTLAAGGLGGVVGKAAAKNYAKNQAEVWAARTGLTTAAALDVAESAGGSAGGAYDESFAIINDVITKRRDAGYYDYTNQQITEMADAYAMDMAQRNGYFAAMTTAALMGVGGLALEKARLGNKFDDAAPTSETIKAYDAYASKITSQFDAWLTKTGKVAGKETIAEFAEEALITNNLEGMLLKWDPDRNVTGNVLFNGFMGAIVAGPITGTLEGVGSLLENELPSFETLTGRQEQYDAGNPMANLLLNINADTVRAVGGMSMYDGGERDLYNAFSDIGLDFDTTSALIGAANDASYLDSIVQTSDDNVDSDFGELPPPNFDTFPTVSYTGDTTSASDLYYDPATQKTYQPITGIGTQTQWVPVSTRDISIGGAETTVNEGGTFIDKLTGAEFKVLNSSTDNNGRVSTRFEQLVDDPINPGSKITMRESIARDKEVVDSFTRFANTKTIIPGYGWAPLQDPEELRYPKDGSGTIKYKREKIDGEWRDVPDWEWYLEKAKLHNGYHREVASQILKSEGSGSNSGIHSVLGDVTQAKATNLLHGNVLFDGDGFVSDVRYMDIRSKIPNSLYWDATNPRTLIDYHSIESPTNNTGGFKVTNPYYHYKGSSYAQDTNWGLRLIDPRTNKKYIVRQRTIQNGPTRLYGFEVFNASITASGQYVADSRLYEQYNGQNFFSVGSPLTNEGSTFSVSTYDDIAVSALQKITEVTARNDPSFRDQEFFDSANIEPREEDLRSVDLFLRAEMTKAGMSRDQADEYIYSKTAEEHLAAIDNGDVVTFTNATKGLTDGSIFDKAISLDDAREQFRISHPEYEPSIADLEAVSTGGMGIDAFLAASEEDIAAQTTREMTQIVTPDSADSKMTIDEWRQFVQDDLGWTEEQAYNYAQDYATQLQASLDYDNRTQAQFKQRYTSLFDGMVISEEEAVAEYARLYPDYTPTAADIQAIITGANATSSSSEAAMTATLNSGTNRARVEAEIARIAQEQADRDDSIANEPPPTSEHNWSTIQGGFFRPNQEEALALLDASSLPKGSVGYEQFYNAIFDEPVFTGRAYQGDLAKFENDLDKRVLTRQELEDALATQHEVPRDAESMGAAVDAALAAGVVIGYQLGNPYDHDTYNSRYASNNVSTYLRDIKEQRVRDLFTSAGLPFTNRAVDAYWQLPVDELTNYIDGRLQHYADEETDAKTLDRYETEGILINKLGVSNVIPNPNGEGNVRNPELDRLIDTYFADAGLLGVDNTVSANDRLQQGYEAAKEAHDAARVTFMEDNYGITPTPEQLERLRSATDTQWINDDEILQARRDLAAANNEKTLSPREVAYYLSDLGLSYDSDDGIYKAIMGMGFAGEGGATFDADQRAAIAAEVTRLRAEYDAEQAAEAAAAELDRKRNAVKAAFATTDYIPKPAEIDQFLDNTEGVAGFVQGKRDDTEALFGDYDPSEQEITDYLNNNAGIGDFVLGKRTATAALFGDYNPTSQEITDYLNNNAGVAGFVQGKRDDTETAFGDYNPSEAEITTYLNNNGGIAQYVDDNTITQDEVKKSLEDQGFVVPEDFNYNSFIGKKPESGLAAATKSWRDGNTVTEAEVKSALEAQGFTVPEDFNYDAFTGKNKPDSLIDNQVGTYLEPRQYTRAEAKADLAAELGIGVGAIDEEVYGTYLDQIVQLNGDTNADATGKTQVETDITNADDVRSYLQGLDYDTTGLSNEDLLAFAGTGLGIDLGTATSDYQAANETITQRNARLAAEEAARLAAQKRTETITAFGDYGPNETEIAQFLDNNAGIAQYVDDNTITQDEVKKSLEDQGFVVPEGFDYSQYTGKKPQANLGTTTKAWRDANTVTETEVKLALEAEGFTVPEDFNYDAFTGKNKPDTGIKGQVDTYLEPRQYTRVEAKADLSRELGISYNNIDEEIYGAYLDQIVQLNGDTNADATGRTQVQGDITNAGDVRSYLQGLDYDTTGLSNKDLLAFAGTGLNVDLGTVTSDYQTANETITQRDARLAAEAKVAALATEIRGYLDDPNQDGGAYTDPDYYEFIVEYLSSGPGSAAFEAMDAAQRKDRVQITSVDRRRYSESEVVADIKAAFPADKDLSVEDLKAKYPTLFALVGDGGLNPTTHEGVQKAAFDEGTITGDEANAYFRDVLGYGEGWIPSGNIASRLVGVGNEATVLPEDIANLTGKTLDLYNETTVTQDEVIEAMIANPTDFGFADAAAVGQAISEGLDLSAYTGRYWQTGGTGTAETSKSLVDRLDDDTISQDEIDAYLTEQGYDPATAGTFDSSLGFGTTSVEDITSGYRSGVDADRAEAAEIQRQTDAINAALDDATQDGGAYTPSNRQGYINWFLNNRDYEDKTVEQIKASIYNDIDNKRYTRSEVADDLRAAFPADAGLSIEDLEAKYAGAFDLVKTGAYATDGQQRIAFDAATTTEAEARKSLEDQGYVIPEGFDFTNFTGVMNSTELANNVYQHLSPLQYTRADAEAALAAELGRPLTAEDLTTYKDYLDGLVDMTGATTNVIGDAQIQGDITSEQEVRDYLSDYTLGEDFSFDGLTGLDVDLDDALGDFKASNRTTAQNQIAADLGTKGWADASDADIAAVESLDSAGRDAWIADRQFTRDQAIAALAVHGIDANHRQFESLVTQLIVDKGEAGTPTTQGELVDNPEDELIDEFITTQAEVDAEFGKYGYFDPTSANIPTGVHYESTLEGLVGTYVDDNYVSADEARAALDGIAGVDAYEQDLDGNYVITDDQLLGMGLTGQYDPTTLGTNVDAATTTEEEVVAAFGEDYTPTEDEIARYVGLLPDGDIGTTIPAYVADRMDTLVSDVGDLSLTVSQLEAQLNGALADGGSLDQAVSKVADDLGIAEDALLKLIGDNSNKFDDLEAAFGTQATGDQEATGIWANIADLEGDVGDLQDEVGGIQAAFGTQGTTTAGEDGVLGTEDDVVVSATGIYGIIDQVAEGVLSNDEAIAALQGVVGEPATYAEDGVTVLTPATGIYAQSGTGVNAEVLQAIDAVYEYVGQADFASDTTVQQVADLLGKPADLVTQDDIDMATSIFGEFEGTYVPLGAAPEYQEGQVDSYDANSDGYIDQADVDLLTELYGGVDAAYNNVVEGLPEGSRFASTGVFGILDQQNRNQAAANQAITDQAATDAETNADTLAEINATINANINTQNERYLQELLAEEARLGGSRRVDTTYEDPGDIEYMYDFESIFANPEQEKLYGDLFGGASSFGTRKKAAATGGLIDSTDELLKILGK